MYIHMWYVSRILQYTHNICISVIAINNFYGIERQSSWIQDLEGIKSITGQGTIMKLRPPQWCCLIGSCDHARKILDMLPRVLGSLLKG